MTDEELLSRFPARAPHTRLAWTAIVDIAPAIDLGPSPAGHRYMVPILGGRFQAGEVDAALSGKVLPGGADRQVLRPDGIKELDAIYEMETTDGTILSIRNRVIVDTTRLPERYAMSVIAVQAPEGPFAWLNRRLFVGTLASARPAHPAVIVRAWEADS